MEDLIYTMVLSDGTIIENLRKNGDNYISASKLTADMFDGKLSEVTVKTLKRLKTIMMISSGMSVEYA